MNSQASAKLSYRYFFFLDKFSQALFQLTSLFSHFAVDDGKLAYRGIVLYEVIDAVNTFVD